MFRTRKIDELAQKLGVVASGHVYHEVITACALLTAWSIADAYDSHENRLAALEALEVFHRKTLLKIQDYKREKEANEKTNPADA